MLSVSCTSCWRIGVIRALSGSILDGIDVKVEIDNDEPKPTKKRSS